MWPRTCHVTAGSLIGRSLKIHRSKLEGIGVPLSPGLDDLVAEQLKLGVEFLLDDGVRHVFKQARPMADRAI